MLIGYVLLLSTVSGCKVSDALFAVFSKGYTEGGYSEADKKYHYDRQIEGSQHYNPFSP
ncbi:MAG TPA: hypothetical protein P5307_18560 [Pirellulaceae bacterium]|nr:hypothetical protein [Pirellulaceae bacterium]